MDLSSITASNATVEIRHPGTSEPIGLTIHIRPAESREVREVRRRITNESIKSRARSITAEKAEANALDILVASVAGWAWGADLTWGGEKLECTPANVRRVLKEAPWIKAQIDEAFGDDARFYGASD